MAVLIIIDNTKSMNRRGPMISYDRPMPQGFMPTTVPLLDIAKQACEIITNALLSSKQPPLLMLARTGHDRSSILSYVRNSSLHLKEKLRLLQVEDDQQILGGMSYSVSLLFDIVNKYRVQVQADRFGYGYLPWMLYPAYAIIFTDTKYCSVGTVQGERVELSLPSRLGSGQHMNDLIDKAYRWDQKIFAFILLEDGERSESFSNKSDLFRICTITGGDYFFCKSVEDAIEKAKELLFLFPPAMEPSAIVNLTNDGTRTQSQSHPEQSDSKLNTKIKIKNKLSNFFICELKPMVTNKMWPIPEESDLCYLHATEQEGIISTALFQNSYGNSIDILCRAPNAKSGLPKRTAQPLIHWMRVDDTSANAICLKCKELNVPYDQYALKLTTRQPHKKNVGYFNEIVRGNSCVIVYIKGNNNCEEMNSTIPCGTFGLIHGKSKKHLSVSTLELLLLPYNFHILLPLLSMGRELKAANDLTCLLTWRQNMNTYLHSTPPYYHVTMWNLLSRLELIPLVAFPPIATIASNVTNQMQPINTMVKTLEHNCLIDIIAIDSVAKYEGYTYDGLTETMQTRPIATTALQTPIERELELIPQSLQQIHSNDLLFTWEHMRKHLFGGCGYTVKGLFFGNDMIQMQSMYKPSNFDSDLLWYSKAVGAYAMPQKTSVAMGNYTQVLSRKEGLRDPTIKDETANVDENSPAEIIRRKLSVNFGNRYSGSDDKSKALDVLVDDKEFLAMEGIVETAIMDANVDSDIINTVPGMKLMETMLMDSSALYGDTPFPSAYGGTDNDSEDATNMFLSFTPNTNGEDSPIIASSQSASEKLSIFTVMDLPHIGLPPIKRVAKRKRSGSDSPLSRDAKHSFIAPEVPTEEDDILTQVGEMDDLSTQSNHSSSVLDGFISSDGYEDDDEEQLSSMGALEASNEDVESDIEMDGDDFLGLDNKNSNDIESSHGVDDLLNLPKDFVSTTPKQNIEVQVIVHSTPLLLPSLLQSTSKERTTTDSVLNHSEDAAAVASKPSNPVSPRQFESVGQVPINPIDLPVDWVQCVSKREGKTYWFNSRTGQSSWTFPNH